MLGRVWRSGLRRAGEGLKRQRCVGCSLVPEWPRSNIEFVRYNSTWYLQAIRQLVILGFNRCRKAIASPSIAELPRV